MKKMEFYKLSERKNNEAGKVAYVYKKHTFAEELLEYHYEDMGHECVSVYCVLKGNWTPYGAVRDCGDHYIKANYSSYDRIDKVTFQVTRDVEDI